MANSDVIVQLKLRGAEQMSRDAKKAADGIGKIGSSARNAGSGGMTMLENSSRRVGSTLGSLIGVAKRAVIGVTAVSAVAGAFAAKSGISYLQTVDRQRVAFETFTGSAKKAAWIMKQIEQLATDSPALDVSTAGAGVSSLMSYGLAAKEAIGLTRKLSDAAAASGQSVDEAMKLGALAIGQISAKGKLSTEELNQLSEGVRLNRSLVAKELGMSGAEFAKALQSGQITAERAIPAIGRALDKQFKGAQARYAKTTEGRVAGLMDKIGVNAGKFLRPFYNQVGVFATKVTGFLDKIDGAKLGKQVFGWVKTGMALLGRLDLGKWFGMARQGIAAVAGMLSRIDWGSVFDAVKGGVELAVAEIKKLLDALKPALPFVQNVLFPLVKGIAKGVGGAIVGAIRIAIPVIGFLARALGWIGEKARPLRGWIEKLGMVLGMLFPGSFLRIFGAVLKGFAAAGGIVGRAAGLIAAAVRVASAPLRALMGGFGAARRAIQGFAQKGREATGMFGKAWGAVSGRIRGWIDSVVTKFQWLEKTVLGVLGKIVGWIEKVMDKIGALTSAVTGLGTNAATPTAASFNRTPQGSVNPVTGVRRRAPAPSAARTSPNTVSPGARKRQQSIEPRQPGEVPVHATVQIDGRPIYEATVAGERRRTEHR